MGIYLTLGEVVPFIVAACILVSYALMATVVLLMQDGVHRRILAHHLSIIHELIEHHHDSAHLHDQDHGNAQTKPNLKAIPKWKV